MRREDRIASLDVLGPRPDRYHAFSTGLLDASEDDELADIVEQTAEKLQTPISIVTLVLERIQFFKAHYGLPSDLAASRATERCVSFCQFVVRDRRPFAVVDAANDPRVPHALVERYGIKAYLGVPLEVNGVVVGSLCVIDTQTREFSDEQLALLLELAQRADRRLKVLAARRKRSQAALTLQVVRPGLQELHRALDFTERSRGAAHLAATTVSCHLKLRQFEEEGHAAPAGVVAASLEQAQLAMGDLEEALEEVGLNLTEVHDCANALHGAVSTASFVRLSEVLQAAQDLARHPCRESGGVWLPMLSFDVELAAPRAIAVGLLSRAMCLVAAQNPKQAKGLHITVRRVEDAGGVVVSMNASAGDPSELAAILDELSKYAAGEPSLRVDAGDESLEITLNTL